MHAGGEHGAVAIGGGGPAVLDAADEAVELDLFAGEDEEDVAGDDARVLQFEFQDGGQAVLLFEGFERVQAGVWPFSAR